jgi:DNA-binding transcriptional LysR family regulator
MGAQRRVPKSALNYFGEVARCRSIRQAADSLYVAPSAVSRQIAKLERAVGVPLFERRASGMLLTPAGGLLAEYLGRADRELERALSAIDDLKGLSSGVVSINTVEGMIDEFLPKVVEAYRAKFPAVTFRIRVESALSVMEAVVADKTDIGIGFNVPPRNNLLVAAQHPQPILMICGPSHPLAKKRKVSLKGLLNHQLALQDRNFWIRRLVDDAFAQTRLPCEPFLVTNSLLLLKSLVKQGKDAITFLPSYAVRGEVERSELIAIPTDSPILNAAHLDVCIHASRRLSTVAAAFLRLTQEALNQLDR